MCARAYVKKKNEKVKKKRIVCQTHWVAITLTKVRKDVTVNTKKNTKYKMPKRVLFVCVGLSGSRRDSALIIHRSFNVWKGYIIYIYVHI